MVVFICLIIIILFQEASLHRQFKLFSLFLFIMMIIEFFNNFDIVDLQKGIKKLWFTLFGM